MPNAIKYSVSTQTLALKKGNYWIGTGDVSKSPTSTTDYWNGITPPSGGYTIYLNKESNGPSIYVPTNDAELISLTNRIAGAAYTTAKECLVYFAGQTDKMVFNVDYESIVTDGLVLNLDAGFVSSYPATGSTWYDLSGNNNNGTLVNGPTFNSSNGGSIVFDGTDDYVNLTSTIQFNTNDFSICGWFRSDSGNTSYKQIWNSGYNGGNPDVEIGLESPTNYLYFYIRPPAVVEEVVKTSYSVNDNLWRYFTATKTSSTISLYVNGALVSSKSGTYTSDVDSAGVIPRIGNGLSNINNRPFKGNIAYVSTYSRALTASEISQNYNAQKGRYGDADYLAFYSRVIAAGGSLTETEQTATNQLVLDLKTYGIWTAMKAIYPMVGASAASCAQNLKSSSFTGSFTSGWTFASSGATPNGSAYMNTNYQPSVSGVLNSTHISYYSRTNTTNSTWAEMGSGIANAETYLLYEYQNLSYIANNSGAILAPPNISTPNGLFINSRSSSSIVKRFHKNVLASYNLNSNSLTSKNMYVGAYNGPTTITYTQRQCAFSSIGDGLTDTQATNFYTAVQAFNTTLSRQV